MNPDVVAAIARLRADNVLSGPQATLLNRVARRHLVSVRLEIRLLLYVGVLLLTSGVGVLVVEHQHEIGPLAIAGCARPRRGGLPGLGRAHRRRRFRGERSSRPNVAFDYILLLGLLLFASDLGYVEAQFTVLGPRWAHHLLIVGVVYLLAAYRWDSRTVLGLALTTLAAWRGVSVSLTGSLGMAPRLGDLRANAIVIGLLYMALATLAVRLERKAHFEEVFGNTGLVLLLGALVSGVLDSSTWGVWGARCSRWRLSSCGSRSDSGARSTSPRESLAAYLGLLKLLFQGPAISVALPRRRAAGHRSARADLRGAPTDDRAMRRESVAWERAAEVREAAEGWLRARIIGTPTYEAIRNAYPDPCVTPSAVWRVLTAVMVTAVTVCTLGALWLATRPGSTGLALLLFVLGVAAWVVTERLEASPRSAGEGAAGATAFWGSVFVLVGLGIFVSEARRSRRSRPSMNTVLLASALVWAASCWRWGSPLFAASRRSRCSVCLWRLPLGRALWLLAGAALVGLFARRPDDLAWAPSHRRAAMVLLVVGVGAVYAAINVYSLDEHFVEGFVKFAPRRGAPPSLAVRGGRGHRDRRAARGDSVVGVEIATDRCFSTPASCSLALSLVTLRHYVHVAPLWVVLTASGAAAHRPGARRRAGTCGQPRTASAGASRRTRSSRTSDGSRCSQTVPVVAAFTPRRRTSPPPTSRGSPAAEARSAAAALRTSSEARRGSSRLFEDLIGAL